MLHVFKNLTFAILIVIVPTHHLLFTLRYSNLPAGRQVVVVQYIFQHFYPPNNLATPNAAPAATAPIKVTRRAPYQGCTPVTLLLKNPKIKRQRSVSTTEIFNPSAGDATKK